jgi:hypothetical protein
VTSEAAWRANLVQGEGDICGLLRPGMRIAVVGLRESGPSFEVALYLQRAGHRIVPVTPKHAELLGERAYRTLPEVPGRIDIVDVFRAPERVPPHAEEALLLAEPPAVFWMQQGIRNAEAAERLARSGIKVVQDRCLKVEWARCQRL